MISINCVPAVIGALVVIAAVPLALKCMQRRSRTFAVS